MYNVSQIYLINIVTQSYGLFQFTRVSVTGHTSGLPHSKYSLFSSLFCLDSLRSSQQFFSCVGTGLPGLNQY